MEGIYLCRSHVIGNIPSCYPFSSVLQSAEGELPLQQQNPEDPQQQLWGAVGAVFGSWMNQRAKTYRKLHDIPEDASGERIVLTEGVLMSFVRKFLRRTKRNLARLWTRYPPWEVIALLSRAAL